MNLPSRRVAGAIGAASGVVLILSMFLDWYKLDLPSRIGGRSINIPTYNAFEGLKHSDVYLVIAASLGILFAAILIARLLVDSPAPAVLLLLAALFVLALIIYRGTSRPGKLVFGASVDTTLQFGWFIALLAAAGMTIAGVLAYLAGPRLQLEPDEFEDEEEEEAAPERGSARSAPAAEEPRRAQESPEPGRET
jgi:hypothetical protein